MNAKRMVVLGVVVLGLLSPPAAQAFYNPHIGRWLSRDPLNELGHQVLKDRSFRMNLDEENSLYAYVRNSAVNLYDPDGRIVPLVIVGGVAIVAAKCGAVQADIAHQRFADSGDLFKHCWVSCRMSKTCGGGLGALAQLGKEGWDALKRTFGVEEGDTGSWLDSLEDMVANQQCVGWEASLGPAGGWIGAACRRSCEACCRQKVGYHNSGHD